MQAFNKPSRLDPCPPHGPQLVLAAVKESSYAFQCVACGLKGSARGDRVEAKRALLTTGIAHRDEASRGRWPRPIWAGGNSRGLEARP
jgi:hypothetical protein